MEGGIMPVRKAEAQWNGSLLEGNGHMKMATGAYDGPFSFKSRMENGPGTNPEELIAAAHAGCFSMAFSAGLGKAGFTPKRVHTTAAVHFDKVDAGFAITSIELSTEAEVPGIDEPKFQELAEGAKKNCPVSKALAATPISLTAKLVK
jgi:lipoyl-dependent peroxiredoxin